MLHSTDKSVSKHNWEGSSIVAMFRQLPQSCDILGNSLSRFANPGVEFVALHDAGEFRLAVVLHDFH